MRRGYNNVYVIHRHHFASVSPLYRLPLPARLLRGYKDATAAVTACSFLIYIRACGGLRKSFPEKRERKM